MAKVIVISGHPHLERSIMNKTILEELKKAAEGGASIVIDDIAEKGCCHLDVAAEQALLKDADTIVFQFPVYWFDRKSDVHRRPLISATRVSSRKEPPMKYFVSLL